MSTSKVCAVCGKDVSATKRVKDSLGNYHCEPCWEEKRVRAASGVQVVPPRMAAPMPEVGVNEAAMETASAEMVLFAISKDEGPFHKLGNSFTVPGGQYVGPAVASPVAVYLVKKARNQNGNGFGLVGVMLSAALSKGDSISTCHLRDLPAGTQTQIDPKGKLRDKEIVIVAQNTVSFVKAGGFNNTVTFTVGKDKFGVVTGLFSSGKMRRKLEEFGWQLNKQLTPVAAPIHDMRDPEEAAKAARRPMWQRVLLIIGAIVLIILVIAIRVAANH